MLSPQNHYCFNNKKTAIYRGIKYHLKHIHPKLISLKKGSNETTVELFNKLVEDASLTKREDHNVSDDFVETYANKAFMDKFPFELKETLHRASFCLFTKDEDKWFSLPRDEKRILGLYPHSVEFGYNLIEKRDFTAEESIVRYIKGRYGECDIQIHKNSISDIGEQKILCENFKYHYKWDYYTVIVSSMQNKPNIRTQFDKTFKLLDKKIKIDEYKAEVEQLLSNIPN